MKIIKLNDFKSLKDFVLDMTLNCILVYDSITERFFRTPGPWTKYLSVFFCSINIMH